MRVRGLACGREPHKKKFWGSPIGSHPFPVWEILQKDRKMSEDHCWEYTACVTKESERTPLIPKSLCRKSQKFERSFSVLGRQHFPGTPTCVRAKVHRNGTVKMLLQSLQPVAAPNKIRELRAIGLER